MDAADRWIQRKLHGKRKKKKVKRKFVVDKVSNEFYKIASTF